MYEIGAYDIGLGYNPDISGAWDTGDEVEALLGAAARAHHQRKTLMGRPARPGYMQPMPASGAVHPRPPADDREWPIGFDSVAAVAAGATANITQRPQELFRPERIVIPAAIAASFLVNDIKVGNRSQFLSSGALPAATFSETSFGVRLLLDTCQVAMDLALNVTNVSAGAVRFLATMLGRVVK
jgi:hypothetical protein